MVKFQIKIKLRPKPDSKIKVKIKLHPKLSPKPNFNIYFENWKRIDPSKHVSAFFLLIPYLVKRTKEIRELICPRGPKVTMDYHKFYEALFFIVNEGCRQKHSTLFGIDSSTFGRHLKFITNHNILETIDHEITEDLSLPEGILVVDTMAIPSKDGSEMLGYCYKYKGKKCCKIQLLADTDRVIRLTTVEKGNDHDATILRNSLHQINPTNTIKCLADSGYVGKQLYNDCVDKNIELVSQPRATRTKKNKIIPQPPIKMTHVLTNENTFLLKKHRCIIEHLNASVRKFRGVDVKHNKKIGNFKTFLFVAILSINCSTLFLK